MINLLSIIILFLGAVKGDPLADLTNSLPFYNGVQDFTQYAANHIIDYGVTVVVPDNASSSITIYCARSVDKIFNEIPLNDSTVSQKLDFTKETLMMIHGYHSSTTQDWAVSLKQAWAASGRNVNLCLVDWSVLASVDYLTVALINMRVTSMYLANTYLPFLQSKGLQVPDLVLIGHSVGAHITGLIGQTYLNQIKFIIGLDPAGPAFDGTDNMFRLSADDAEYVQVIHSSDGTYGYVGLCGDADYYLNHAMVPQPGCSYTSITDPIYNTVYPVYCSHFTAVYAFIDSLINQPKCIGFQCIINWLGSCYSPANDLFGLDSMKIHGVFYSATAVGAVGIIHKIRYPDDGIQRTAMRLRRYFYFLWFLCCASVLYNPKDKYTRRTKRSGYYGNIEWG